MPYTIPAARSREKDLRRLAYDLRTEGDLTWAISVLMDEWVMTTAGTVSYQTLHRARASAQDAADEWYRRVMAPYEDKKLAENGEVYQVVKYL